MALNPLQEVNALYKPNGELVGLVNMEGKAIPVPFLKTHPITREIALREGEGSMRLGGFGLIASRARVHNDFNAVQQQVQSRSMHIAMDDIYAIQLVDSGWRTQNPGQNAGVAEVDSPGVATVRASIEHPSFPGTFLQVLYSGSPAGTVQPGANLVSDLIELPVPIKRGTAFFIQRFITNPAGCSYIVSQSGAAYGEKCCVAASGLTDQTMTGTMGNTHPTVSAPPQAILGYTSRKTCIIWGDSKAVGTTDTFSDRYMLRGQIDRVLGKRFATLNMSVAGDRMVYMVTGQTAQRRIALANLVGRDLDWVQLGINDLTANRTAAQYTTDLTTFRGMLGYKRPMICSTITPGSTSTDSWATTGNQTTVTSNPQRILLNAAIRNGYGGLTDGYVEVADIVETARDSGIWKAPGMTTDGIHETPAAFLLEQESRSIEQATQLF